jgi:hypothetical protein
MPVAALFLTIVLCLTAFSHSAMAQGASTGGTKDSGSPTMVFPVRPDEPAAPTAVRNKPRRPHPTVRLRQNYYYRIHR